MIESLPQELLLAARSLRRSPTLTLAAVLTLAIGIGANSAMFSLVDAVLLQPLPIADPDSLFVARETNPYQPPGDAAVRRSLRFSYQRVRDFQERVPAGTSVAGTTRSARLIVREPGGAGVSLVRAQFVTRRYFETMGVQAVVGRLFGAGDEETEHESVTAVTSAYAQRRFGSAAAAVGRELTVGGRRLTIIGVVDGPFSGAFADDPTDIWVPVALQQALRYQGAASADDADMDGSWMAQDAIAWLSVVVRAAGDVTAVRTQLAAANHLGLQRASARLADTRENALLLERGLALDPFAGGFSTFREQHRMALLALMALVALILLIAAANLANLLLVRSAARHRDTSVRAALGATRVDLARAPLLESLLLSLVGGVAAALVAPLLSRTLAAAFATESSRPPAQSVTVDLHVFAFTAGLALVIALIVGSLPAWRASRAVAWVAHGSRGTTRGRDLAGMRPLVAVQLGLSFVVVFAALLLGQSLRRLAAIDPGFAQDHLVSIVVDGSRNGYTGDQLPGFNRRLTDVIGRAAGVTSVTVESVGMMSGDSWTSDFRFEGYEAHPGESLDVHVNGVSGGYFSTVGIPLVTGREFDARDTPRSMPVAIINEALAARYFTGVTPIGRRVDSAVIVGIVRDSRVRDLRRPAEPAVYFPLLQVQPADNTFQARVTGEPRVVAREIQQVLREAEPNLQIDAVAPLTDSVARSLRRDTQMTYLTAAFAITALLLACIGLYGVLSHVVTARRHEIGVRAAIGATPANLIGLVLRDSSRVVTGGLLIGALGSAATAQSLASIAFGVGTGDVGIYVLVGLILGATAMLASLVPARRAASLDPLATLRADG